TDAQLARLKHARRPPRSVEPRPTWEPGGAPARRTIMRRSGLVPLLASILAVVTIAACASSASRQAAAPPEPAKLALAPGPGDEARAALYPVRPVRYLLDGMLAHLGAEAPVYRL